MFGTVVDTDGIDAVIDLAAPAREGPELGETRAVGRVHQPFARRSPQQETRGAIEHHLSERCRIAHMSRILLGQQE